MEGKFDGRWYVYYPRLKPDPTKMIITGGGAIGNVTVSSFVADNVTFKTTLKNGQFSIDPIEVTRGSYGKIQARASTSVDQFRRILVGVELAQFPVDFWIGAGGADYWGIEADCGDVAGREVGRSAGAEAAGGGGSDHANGGGAEPAAAGGDSIDHAVSGEDGIPD